MAVQALTMPVDIPWQRLAFSPDMIDTNYEAESLPAKWRSSLAVFGYAVPQEETAEAYPNGRIVYLRLCCSVTGLNLREDLRDAISLAVDDVQLDEVQEAAWEAIRGDGGFRRYYPCLSAIAQLAVYPPRSASQIPLEDYPYFMDFEPKKRELYEDSLESEESLSGSSDWTNVLKGTTTIASCERTDYRKKEGYGQFPTRVGRNEQQAVDMTTTDTSREKRESLSHTTSITQMYQLFTGYHLGMNRVLFTVQCRPHIVTGAADEPAAFNLVNGERRLEGMQDMFTVVYLPAALTGLCLQANLDTGHYLHPDDDDPVLYVTRRVVRTCATFAGAGLTSGSTVAIRSPLAGNEIPLGFQEPPDVGNQLPGFREKAERARRADQLNYFRSKCERAMLDGYTAGDYAARSFAETDLFRRLVRNAFRGVKLDLGKLVGAGYLKKNAADAFTRAGAKTVGDLFDRNLEKSKGISHKQLVSVRLRLIESALRATNVRT